MAANNRYDVVIIGGGPAGLTAAIYLARAKYRVIVLEKERFGGQITITSEVVNYPGVGRTSGRELTETMRRQAESFGAEFLLAEAQSLETEEIIKTVHTTRGDLQCFGILLATGAHPRMVGFPGEAEFRGHGVAYCATCDGEFFTGTDVFVVGGGFAAAEEAVFLTKYASHVYILIRRDDFSCAKSAADAAKTHPKITVLPNTTVEEVTGDTALQSIRYRNTKTGEVTMYTPPEGKTFGVFVFAGYEPETALLKGIAELNGQGYVVTDRGQKTTRDGVYAAGDVCIKNLRQVVTAVGDGAVAATELERYAQACQKATGYKPERPQDTAVASEPAKSAGQGETSGLFQPEVLAQLQAVFARMEQPLVLQLSLDDRPVSGELKAYMDELAGQTDKLTVRMENDAPQEARPVVRVCRTDGTYTGLAFHGVPGGHEFTSFVLGLYNASGSGQAIGEDETRRIAGITDRIELTILVSLSCTMCPELVMAAQKIASMNPNVTAEIYDVSHFPALRDRYHVMSVPCMVRNAEIVTFGRKSISQVLDWLDQTK